MHMQVAITRACMADGKNEPVPPSTAAMSPEASSSQIRHEPDALRFLVEQDGEVAELVYALERGRMVIEHTRVPEAIGGRGIAGQLVRAAFAHARDTGLRVVPA